FFKEEDPIGKVVNLGNEFNFIITGIFQDLPEQSHIKTDFIASISSMKNVAPGFFEGWGWHSSGFYLKLNSNADIQVTELKLADIWNLKSNDRPCTGPHVRSELIPFKDIYLKSGRVVGVISAIDYVIGFSLIAALILAISCFNFINLSIATNAKRKVENGVKKVLGANALFFLRQVLLEMILYLTMAMMLSYIIIKAMLPYVNSIIDKNLSLSVFSNSDLLIFSALLMLVILIVCGTLPVLQMVRVKTLGLLKGTTLLFKKNKRSVKAHLTVRNSLVIAQFAIGIMLIISSLIINSQLKLIRQHNTGFDKEQVLVIDNYEGNQKGRYNLLCDVLKQYPEVKSITCGSNVPFNGVSNWGGPSVFGDKQNQMQGCGFVSVEDNYLDLIGAEFIEGRTFIKDLPSEKEKLIITEALALSLNLDHPIGVKLDDLWDDTSREIVGVVKNIEFNKIHNKSLPVIFFCQRENNIGYHDRIIIKLQTGNLNEIILKIKNYWEEISPDYPIEYVFLDQVFDENYRQESQTSVFFNVMTIIATLLCCMGLFGLALFHIDARIKEIGIRKVNGAKVTEVLALLNKDFVIWVIVAFIVASPVAWYTMNKWLQNFAYKTTLSWWVFAVAGILATSIALVTVGWQSWRAATRNPVESLRYE
ncbi:MAG: FtsX-like permease family protein, partial [Alphaproteobacteria bacterium]